MVMTDRPRTRRASLGKQTIAAPASQGGSGWLSGALIGVALALLGLSWMDANGRAPAAFQDLPTGGVILVVQPGDCPDRTTTLERWFTRLAPAAVPAPDQGRAESVPHQLRPEPLPVAVAEMGAQGLSLPPSLTALLDGLPRLAPSDANRAARALRTMAVEGSPALLVVDARGRPVLASDFTPTGAVPGLATAVALAAAESIPPTRGNAPGDGSPTPWVDP